MLIQKSFMTSNTGLNPRHAPTGLFSICAVEIEVIFYIGMRKITKINVKEAGIGSYFNKDFSIVGQCGHTVPSPYFEPSQKLTRYPL